MDEDQLIADYLRRLSAAAGGLPADRRDELVSEIAAHIAEARAAGPPPGIDPAEHIRDVLSRLGEPDDIVRAAWPADGEDAAAGPPPPGAGAGWAAGAAPGGPGGGWRGGLGAHEITAVILLLIGGFLAGIGWIVGVILLWTSPRWRTRDKWLGTLVWPGGLAAVALIPLLIILVVHHSGPPSSACARNLPPWVASGRPALPGPVAGAARQVPVALHASVNVVCSYQVAPGWVPPLILLGLLVAIAAPVAVAVYLLLRRRRGWPTGTPAAP
jgi:hypothetical protein